MPPAVAAAAVCATCGESLAASGACIACLIRAGLSEDGASVVNGAAAFGDFEIERRSDGSPWELGRGAMGVTYRAIDKVLHRAVALKVIEPPAAASDSQAVRERFLREARAAAALRHPNVAGVFHFSASPELNRCYCAMELVEGETLEARVRRGGPVSVELALEIAIQVTRALEAAAERGLVHRDLKPGNIMLTPSKDPARVEVKVIDFGLAKAAAAAGEMELTHGGFVGTPAFASPEQFAGDKVDARSDIYALGVTLWFALTGRLPSAGTTIDEIRERQVRHKPPVEQLKFRGVPAPIIDLLLSCLAIDPADRPASARELMRALEACRDAVTRTRRNRRRALLALAAAAVVALALSVVVGLGVPFGRSTAALPVEKGVAVLPFDNLSSEASDAFFADGIQDDVLNSLGRIKDLKVIARGSVMSYRGARPPGATREIGRALGVSHVLEGSVRRTDDRVVVNVALISTQDERQLWSRRYERTLRDAISLQGELSLEIARELRARLTPAESAFASAQPTENPEAYLLFLRAHDLQIKASSHAEIEEVIRLYEQAIALDPKFAVARARLSIAANVLFQQRPNPALRTRIKTEADEALRLRPQLGEGYLALAFWYTYQEQDYERATAELQRAADLLPNSAEVPLTAAFIYKRQNRYRERLAALRRAEALDPLNHRVLSFLVLTYRWVRDWPQAIYARDRRVVVTGGQGVLVFSRWRRANDEFQLSGSLDVLKAAVADEEKRAGAPYLAEQLNFARFEIAMLERDYPAAARFLAPIPPEAFTNDALFMFAGHDKSFYEAVLARLGGSSPSEQQEALSRVEQDLRSDPQARDFSPGPSRRAADLALIHALYGRKEEAIREGLRAAEETAPFPGTIETNDVSSALAAVYAQVNEPEKAIDLIEHLLTVPVELQDGTVYNLTHTDLKWRWTWDPLRSHPRFQQLLAGPEPKTVY